MKSSHIKAQFFSILLLTIALLSLITIRSLDSSITIHQILLKKIHQLEHRSYSLNEQILKAKQGILRNYDGIINNIKHIKQDIHHLHPQNDFYKKVKKENIEEYKLLLKASNALSHSIEQFLTNQAIVNNSITGVSVLIKKFNSVDTSNVHLTEQLLNEILLFIRWRETEAQNNIKQILATLASKASTDNLRTTEILNFIKSHSEIILSKTPLVTKSLEHILRGEFTTRLLRLQTNVAQYFNHELKQKLYLDWAIYSMSILLILFVFSFIFALRRSNQSFEKETLFLNTLLNTISDGVVACNNKGTVTLYNQAISKLHGFEDSDLSPEDWNKRCVLYDIENKTPITKQAMPLYRALNDEKIENLEFIIHPVDKNGSSKTVTTHGAKIIDAQNNVLGAVISIQDISSQKESDQTSRQIAEEERVVSKLLESSYLPLAEFLQQASIEIVSLEWLSILPKSGIFLTDNEGESETMSLFCHFQLAPELLTLCAKVAFGQCLCGRAAAQKSIQFAHCVDHRHETRFEGMKPHGHYNVPIMEADKVLGVMVFYLNEGHQQQTREIEFLKRAAHILSIGISRKYAEKKAHYLAYHDALTGLSNRPLLMNRLTQVIATGRRINRFNALVYIDFDHFKHINDSLGHSVGDLLLKELSQRFKKVLREVDTVARLGGDEFVLLISDLSNDHETATLELCRIINKLQTSIAKEFNLKGHRFYITMSAGIVILDGQEDDLEKILMQADTAMYQAKAEGRDTVQFFLPEMQEKALARIILEKDLRHAIEKQELLVYYQPQINIDGTLVGAEALLRWNHTENGFISPVDFIPIAEETGLILEIGLLVLRDACNNINHWQSCETLKHIAVNVSPVQFRQQDYVETVKKVLDETKADPDKLIFELTEGILVDNIEDIITKMEALKQLGISFSVDDFGTGYSSLAYLKRFPLDQLKIDKSFVDDINADHSENVIVETIIAMAERLGFNIIAEGVETQEQLNFLNNHGCYHYQGYYFSCPLPVDQFSEKYL